MKLKIKEKNGKKKIILEDAEIRIVLSNPQIQPHNEYIYNSQDDILYFYYDLTIYENVNYFYSSMTKKEKKDIEKEKTKPKWRKVAHTYAYDFGAITDLPALIDHAINFDIKEKGLKTYFLERDYTTDELVESKTDYECQATFETEGMMYEDVYKITKYCRYFDSSYDPETDTEKPKYIEFYKIFFGCGNTQIKKNTCGVLIDAKEEDLTVIKEWVNAFMEYAKEVTQKKIARWYKEKDETTPYCPYFLKKHLKEKYPEDVDKLKEIYPKLYEAPEVLDEYYDFCMGNDMDPMEITRDGEKYSAKYFMDQGKKDYEAYIELAKKYVL